MVKPSEKAGTTKTFSFMRRKYFLNDHNLYIDSLIGKNIIQDKSLNMLSSSTAACV